MQGDRHAVCSQAGHTQIEERQIYPHRTSSLQHMNKLLGHRFKKEVPINKIFKYGQLKGIKACDAVVESGSYISSCKLLHDNCC